MPPRKPNELRVVFTPYAERQLDWLHRYITEHSFETRADAYVARLVTFCQNLVRFPERGTPRDEILVGLRTTVLARRVTIAYLVDGDTIVIEGIYGRGRDYEQDLG